MKPFADIHCHPTLHSFAFYNSGRKRKNSLWWDNPPKERQRNDKYPEYSQSGIPALARGNVRLIIASLYPLEQPWFSPALTGTGSVTDIIVRGFTVHIPIKYVNKVQSAGFNYFEYLQKEYQFLLKDKGKVRTVDKNSWKYIMAKSADDIDRYRDDTSTIIVIPSIEGAHSLVSGNANDIYTGTYDFRQTLSNIQTLKGWEFPPLFITLGHHFYNGLCGHSRTVPDGVASFLVKQGVGLNEPLNDRGKEEIECLLGINKFEGNGRRILIDIKHMSVASRNEYYEMVSSYNSGKSESERIPIVASHCGYSGHHTMSDSIIIPDTEKSKYEDSETFNPWSVNLSDEDIVEIFNSGGLIGINLDQRILSGMDVIEDSKDFSNREVRKNSEQVVKFWTEQIALNILGMVKAVVDSDTVGNEDKVKAWDIISIGSDFDGMINPVDSFITADEFKDMRSSLKKYMPLMDDYSRCSQGLTIDEILDRIMYDNAIEFVTKNYR